MNIQTKSASDKYAHILEMNQHHVNMLVECLAPPIIRHTFIHMCNVSYAHFPAYSRNWLASEHGTRRRVCGRTFCHSLSREAVPNPIWKYLEVGANVAGD